MALGDKAARALAPALLGAGAARALAAAAGGRHMVRAPGPSPAAQGIEGVSHVVAVASGKGGVGKSTTAVNLAVALATRLGLQVGLLDADVYGPSIPRMMDLHGMPRVDEDELLVPLERWGVKCMSMGFLMKEEEAAVWRGPMVMSALDTFMRKVRWGSPTPLDVLVIDMPPGTGDAQLTISQRLRLSGADIALLDARRGCTMFRKARGRGGRDAATPPARRTRRPAARRAGRSGAAHLTSPCPALRNPLAQVNVPILGIVENMSWFVCGNCGHESHVFGSGGAARAGEEMGMEVLGKIPLVIDIRETAAAAYVSVAERVWQKLQVLDQQPGQRGPQIVVE
eukprot:scaffold7.g3666.t1